MRRLCLGQLAFVPQHNAQIDPAGREQALREIVLVLKPVSQGRILDIRHSSEYARILGDAGITAEKRSAPTFVFLIPSHCMSAEKPH